MDKSSADKGSHALPRNGETVSGDGKNALKISSREMVRLRRGTNTSFRAIIRKTFRCPISQASPPLSLPA